MMIGQKWSDNFAGDFEEIYELSELAMPSKVNIFSKS